MLHNFKYSPYDILDPVNPDEYKQEIVDAFVENSSDKTHLSKFEFKLAYATVLGRLPSHLDMKNLFPISRHKITYQQYLNVMGEKVKKLDRQDQTKKIFKLFDTRGNGYLTIEDVEHAFEFVNASIPKHVVARCFTKYDQNSDGKITYKDFCTMMNTRIMEQQ